MTKHDATGSGEIVSFFGTCPPDWSAGVVHAGYEYCAPDHNWQGVRDYYLLHYVAHGAGRVRVKRRLVSLGPGDIFLFAPGEFLDYTADSENPWHYLWVGFRGMHVSDLVETGIRRGKGPVVELPFSPGVVKRLEEIIDVLKHRETNGATRVTGLLYLLLADLADMRTRSPRSTAEDLVPEAQTFILQNYQREISVSDVVRHIGVDRSHFGRVFRERVGVTVQDYLTRIRMERADRLLAETDVPIRAIAASVGYSTYASFERRFVAWCGRTPTESRRARR